jgi:hypothetical protein
VLVRFLVNMNIPDGMRHVGDVRECSDHRLEQWLADGYVEAVSESRGGNVAAPVAISSVPPVEMAAEPETVSEPSPQPPPPPPVPAAPRRRGR